MYKFDVKKKEFEQPSCLLWNTFVSWLLLDSASKKEKKKKDNYPQWFPKISECSSSCVFKSLEGAGNLLSLEPSWIAAP